MAEAIAKKCPSCGQWGQWNLLDTERCAHCNALLDADAFNERLERETREANLIEQSFFTPRATDGTFMLVVRKTTFVAYVVYSVVTAFVMYVITAIVG